MSEPEFVPDPQNKGEESPFSFSDLNAETVPPLAGDFIPPDVKGTKPRWWERAPKGDKKPYERKARTPKLTPAMPRGGLVGPLTNVYTGIGMSVMPFDPGCGRIIMENAESCAKTLDDLAKTNPAVRRVLISLVTTSAWGAVIMAHAPIVMAIAMHHVPALRERQEKMVGEFAEMMANGFNKNGETEK